jgi:hypothetical protein
MTHWTAPKPAYRFGLPGSHFRARDIHAQGVPAAPDSVPITPARWQLFRNQICQFVCHGIHHIHSVSAPRFQAPLSSD